MLNSSCEKKIHKELALEIWSLYIRPQLIDIGSISLRLELVMSGTFTGKTFGAVIDLTIHAPARMARAKSETAKVAQQNGADEKAVAVLIERIPAAHAKALYNAGQAVYNYIAKAAVSINGQKVVPVPMLETLWVDLFGHADLKSTETVGATGLVCKYNALKAGLVELCRNGELDRMVAEKAGELSSQIAKVDCALINNAFGIDIKLDIDCESEVVRDALDKLSANVREAIQAKAAKDAEVAAGQAVGEITGFALKSIQDVLENVIEKTTEAAKGTQWKTLVNTITDLVDRLPAYNLTGDARVAKAIVDVRERLAKVVSAESLHDDAAARTVAKDAAKDILAELRGEAVADAPVADAPVADALASV